MMMTACWWLSVVVSMLALIDTGPQGRRHRYGHYGHDHSTVGRAMAINDFGHNTFLHYVLFTQARLSNQTFLRLNFQ